MESKEGEKVLVPWIFYSSCRKRAHPSIKLYVEGGERRGNNREK